MTTLGIFLGAPSKAVAKIADINTISINFSQALYSAKEADGRMIITLEADGYYTWPFFVLVKPMEVADTAGATGGGVDFESDTLIAIFAPGVSQVNVSMIIAMDGTIEPTEMLKFTLSVPVEFSNVNGRFSVKAGKNNTADGKILNSGVLVNFTASSYKASVDTTEVIVHLTALGNFDTPFIVNVIPDSEDIAGRDGLFYNPDLKEVLFPAGSDTALVHIFLLLEELCEPGSFNVTLEVPENAINLGVMLGLPSQAIVEVPSPSPGAVVNFIQSKYYVKESNQYVAIGIRASRKNFNNSFSLKINRFYRGLHSSSKVSEADFDSTCHVVDVQAQQSIVTTDIAIYDDFDSEDTESFYVEIVVPPGSAAKGVRLGNQQIATVHIKDDDVSLSFDQERVTVTENEGFLQFRLLLSWPIDYPFEVELQFNDVSAVDGVDYKYSSNRILFSSKRSYNMMRIDIVDDDVAEPPEEFVIKVTRIVTPGISLATGNSTKLLGIIDDNDVIIVEFQSEEYKGCSTTDGVINVTLTASKAASLPYNVTILPSELPDSYVEQHPAKVNSDFSSVPVVVTFYSGETVKSGNVTLLSDPMTSKLVFALNLSQLDSNIITVKINMEQETIIGIITCN
ncbi:extracellular matrix organizing protein FRAS1-like [Dysidea avara]|uniref:extracellular matrix organizing protein FRAS1-like n=1 Tax=Dysidea avara TaxID=196820 RepID=UPI00332068CA